MRQDGGLSKGLFLLASGIRCESEIDLFVLIIESRVSCSDLGDSKYFLATVTLRAKIAIFENLELHEEDRKIKEVIPKKARTKRRTHNW